MLGSLPAANGNTVASVRDSAGLQDTKLSETVGLPAPNIAASLERDPCVHHGKVTVVIEREATLAHQSNGMAIMPFDRLE